MKLIEDAVAMAKKSISEIIIRYFGKIMNLAEAITDEACKVIDSQADKTLNEVQKMLLIEQS